MYSESGADASWNLGLDFGDFGVNGKLDMEPSREDSADETCLDRGRHHTGDHGGRFAKQTGVRCVDVDGTITIRSHQH